VTFTVYGQPLEPGTCDRCRKPIKEVHGEWRHTTYAKRGELCLHPSRNGRKPEPDLFDRWVEGLAT
jgi:hypothetical protein